MEFETSTLGFVTDSEKLRLLAEWFDLKYPNDKNPEVQNDLRRIADNLDSTSGVDCFIVLTLS